jgi:hypothetical protein
MRYFKFLFLFLLLSFSNCASFQNYLSNRALDFTDILTLGGEVNIYGGSFWLWCFGGGAQIGQFGDGYGMRNGYFGYYRTGGREKLGDLKMGNSFFLMNSQEHLPEAYHTKRSMNKVYTHANFLFFLPANLQGRRGIIIIQEIRVIVITIIMNICNPAVTTANAIVMHRLISNYPLDSDWGTNWI